MIRSVIVLFMAMLLPAHAQSFDGEYEGKLLLTQGTDCGEKSETFTAQVKGKTIRIVSARADKPLDGQIQDSGQFFVTGPGRGNVTLEWRAQILATKTGLGTMLQKGSSVCQFLLSLKRN